MSVPVWKRNESKLEFLSNFHKLRKESIKILMRDFGTKKKTYSVLLLEEIYELNEEDRAALEDIAERNGISASEIDKYPSWMIKNWRSEILRILNCLGVEIELANSVYITSEEEYNERRKHLNLAIGYCNALKDKFQEIIDCINVSVGAYEIVGDKLQKEIKLLKGVRKADNKKLNNLRQEL